MHEIVYSLVEHMRNEYQIELKDPESIVADGRQHRYKCVTDKGNSKSIFITFYLDSNPMAVLGHWKKYGSTAFKWFYRNQSELSPQEKAENEALYRKRKKENEERIKRERYEATVKAGDLWFSGKDLGDIDYPYCKKKSIIPFGAKFFRGTDSFETFATDELKQKAANGQHKIYDLPVMVVPVSNRNNQLVGLQQISSNGKFKGFLPNAQKKGGFVRLDGDDSIVFIVEGYATGCTIHEISGCTTYIAFDSGNLMDVAAIIKDNHPDAIHIVASDNDRFAPPPHGNVGQKKAKELVDKFRFFNLKPNFYDNQDGSDWNDLLLYYSKQVLRDHLLERVKKVVDYVDG